MKLTSIVATIGPASHDIDKLESLIKAGVNIVRMNFSHGDHDYHGQTITNTRALSQKLDRHIGVLLDTKGPEIRTGKLVDGNPIQLVAGQQIIVTTQEILGDTTQIAISYKELCEDVVVGGMIMIADGLICLEIKEIKADHVICTIRNG
jgi:pyruvate kinase